MMLMLAVRFMHYSDIQEQAVYLLSATGPYQVTFLISTIRIFACSTIYVQTFPLSLIVNSIGGVNLLIHYCNAVTKEHILPVV